MNGFVADTLVIGYGNDLRSDDGAGRWVAEQLEARRVAGLEVRSVPQLTPELALAMAGRSLVVFVDANVDATELTVEPVDPSDATQTVMTHHGNPASLVSLVSEVGSPPERAFVVSVPASNLGMGFELSPSTQAAAEEAVERIIELASGGQGQA